MNRRADEPAIWQDGWAHGHEDGWNDRGAGSVIGFLAVGLSGLLVGAAGMLIIGWLT